MRFNSLLNLGVISLGITLSTIVLLLYFISAFSFAFIVPFYLFWMVFLLIGFTDKSKMRKQLFLQVVAIISIANSLNAQVVANIPPPAKSTKGTFYFSWGYNKDWFSKSDIHFKNQPDESDPVLRSNASYDFTVYDARAKDRPGFKDMYHTAPTIPQYVYRVGYYFNNKHDLGIEINFDHVKYVMRNWQTLHVKGTIHGETIDKDTLINPDNFLHFEHTNGANFLMLNIMKRQSLLISANKKHWLSGIVKLGAGVVIPKTEVVLFGEEMDNRFHIAGYCAGLEAGLRYDTFKYIFLEYTGKGAFANYTNVLTIGSGKANHHFWTFENILVLGLQVPF
ncbi:MAG: hypothetical protein H0W84_05665 [Bacteroidetes bacterium]|nr:hypothetical protein [Bacteroidota bacterium]